MNYDAVIIGGGRAGMTLACALQDAGLRCCVVAEGRSLSDPLPGRAAEIPASDGSVPPAALPDTDLRTEFKRGGGTLLAGDSVVSGHWDGKRLVEVLTRNYGDVPLQAPVFALCTGKFFGRGLLSTMDSIYEPVFGADVQFEADRTRWYDPDFSRPQPFESFGVRTAEDGRVLFGGVPAENLWAAGEILCAEALEKLSAAALPAGGQEPENGGNPGVGIYEKAAASARRVASLVLQVKEEKK